MIKYNKKGFTLVELIVVIAIIAVLSGTVAGVTVSQLLKQTDNNYYNNQAPLLAKSLQVAILSINPPDIYDSDDEQTRKFVASKIQSYLQSEIVGATDINWETVSTIPAKAHFSVFVNQTGDTSYIAYTGKQASFGTKYYIIDKEGNYSKIDTMIL